MNKLQNISAIDTNKLEGRYLMAALAILTTTPNIVILGQDVEGTSLQPDEMLEQLHKSQEEMYKDTPSPVSYPKGQMEERPTFEKALEKLINSYSMENGSDTPDFILATHLVGALEHFNTTVRARNKWYASSTKGTSKEPGNESNSL